MKSLTCSRRVVAQGPRPNLREARPLVVLPAGHLFLFQDLIFDLGLLVQLVERVDDDGDGQGDDEDAADGAARADHLAEPGLGGDVAVAHAGHGDDGPVQGGWHRDELVRVGVLFHDKGEAAEDEHAHDHDQG